MKKFRSTQHTYEKLLEEIQFLKKHTILFNSQYNESKDRYNESKKELEELREQINRECHENKVNITNFNKDYVEELDKKKKQLEKLEYSL